MSFIGNTSFYNSDPRSIANSKPKKAPAKKKSPPDAMALPKKKKKGGK